MKKYIWGVLMLISSNCFSSILLEPHIAYNFSSNADYSTAKVTYNGRQYGARLGYRNLGLMIGSDYTYSTLNYKVISGGTTEESDYKRQQAGAFIGYRFPRLLKIWYTYYFTDYLTQTGPWRNSIHGDSSGTGYEIGIGIITFPHLNINILYKNSSYDKVNNNGTITTLNPKLISKEYALGLSFPFGWW